MVNVQKHCHFFIITTNKISLKISFMKHQKTEIFKNNANKNI